MSLFAGPEVHAANPPSTWEVRGASGAWRVVTAEGYTLGPTHRTRAAALAAIDSSPERTLYDRETRWYAGEPVAGWRPYADLLAEGERQRAARLERQRLARIAAGECEACAMPTGHHVHGCPRIP